MDAVPNAEPDTLPSARIKAALAKNMTAIADPAPVLPENDIDPLAKEDAADLVAAAGKLEDTARQYREKAALILKNAESERKVKLAALFQEAATTAGQVEGAITFNAAYKKSSHSTYNHAMSVMGMLLGFCAVQIAAPASVAVMALYLAGGFVAGRALGGFGSRDGYWLQVTPRLALRGQLHKLDSVTARLPDGPEKDTLRSFAQSARIADNLHRAQSARNRKTGFNFLSQAVNGLQLPWNQAASVKGAYAAGDILTTKKTDPSLLSLKQDLNSLTEQINQKIATLQAAP